jgi:hypothetical protein
MTLVRFKQISGSILTTASVNLNTITFTKGDGTAFNITVNTGSGGSGGGGGGSGADNLAIVNTNQIQLTSASVLIGSPITVPFASNSFTASYATTASYALNGGVTQIIAGPNITLSPITGLGQVTVSAASGGGFNTATGSYGSFYDTTTQTNPVGNIPRSMSLNTTDITNGVSVSGSTNPFNTYIKTENAGVYDIQFSAQLDKTDSGTDEVVIWLRKNGINLTDTATTVTLAGNNAKNVAAWNWFVNSAANDYYQIIWQSADTDVRLFAEPTDGHPGIPSVIVTVNRVDQFLSNTGSFTGSFTGQLIGTASWATNALTASFVTASNVYGPYGSNSILSASYALSSSFAQSSSYSLSSSFAVTSSYAANGGVTRIVAGTNVTISPTNGLGDVTINSSGGGGGSSATSNLFNYYNFI